MPTCICPIPDGVTVHEVGAGGGAAGDGDSARVAGGLVATLLSPAEFALFSILQAPVAIAEIVMR